MLLIGFNVLIFILISLIARGLRFFLVSYLSAKFGQPFINFLEKKGALWSSIIGALIIIFFTIIYLILK